MKQLSDFRVFLRDIESPVQLTSGSFTDLRHVSKNSHSCEQNKKRGKIISAYVHDSQLKCSVFYKFIRCEIKNASLIYSLLTLTKFQREPLIFIIVSFNNFWISFFLYRGKITKFDQMKLIMCLLLKENSWVFVLA